MFRKQTRPKMVVMPRRDPSFQLSSRHPSATPCPSLRRPLRPGEAIKSVGIASSSRTPAPPRTSLHRPHQRQGESRKPAPKTEPAAVLPRQVKISTCARDPVSLLREILLDKTKALDAEKNYTFQIPVIVQPRESHRARPAFTGFKLHRLWKLQPGFYCLLGWDKPSREVLLRQRNCVFRTPLPNGVIEPPDNTTTYLEIGRPEDGQKRRRVSVKWVSV